MSDKEESGEQHEGECPVCGQEYAHKREEDASQAGRRTATLRSDATECKTADHGYGKRTVYVHV